MPERLSAYLDDELPPAELERLLASLQVDGAEADGVSAEKLARYSLIGECLRGAPAPTALALRRRVNAAIEQAPMVGPVPASRPNIPPAVRLVPLALAAALAVAAVGLVQFLRQGAPAPGATLAARATPGEAANPLQSAAATPTSIRRATLSPDRLTNYLVYHGKYSGMLSAQVMDSHIVNSGARLQAVNLKDPGPP